MGGRGSGTGGGSGYMKNQGFGQWYGENAAGYGVSINESGDEDINMYRYGSRKVYEVDTYGPTGRRSGGGRRIFETKGEAMSFAEQYLKDSER